MLRIDGFEIEPIIGLEIHVQLATRTKMFCGCPLEFAAPPNSRTCPVCLGLPGALPVVNAHAVELAIRTGLALHCRVADVTRWDRKSYFYPDLPKNYQISQFDRPVCERGYFELPFDGRIRKIRIRRAHLEEDAGKNSHEAGGWTAIDLNRAGTPLLEIVTEPDMRSAEEVREFAVQLQRLVRYLGVSEANMMKGQMRFEPNINLKIRDSEGVERRTPIVEVKNLNSFRAVFGAIEYEVRRQFDEWREKGATAAAGNKQNRGWDDAREVTLAQREKEESADYRYFPDPDILPLKIDASWVHALSDDLPEMPLPRTERFICEYKLPQRDAPALVEDRATADLLDHAAEAGGDKLTLGKHFLSFWQKLANQRGGTIANLGIAPTCFAELANLTSGGEVNATAAAQIADEIVRRCEALRQNGDGAADRDVAATIAAALPAPAFSPTVLPSFSPAQLAAELGLIQNRDDGQIAQWVEAALRANEQAVRDALDNPKKLQAARGFLTGQVMKLSAGAADPKRVASLLEAKLASLRGQ